MTAKKVVMSKKIEGELIFKEVNPTQVQFDFDKNKSILSNRNLDVARNLVPGDFDHEKHTVKAKYVIEIKTEEK